MKKRFSLVTITIIVVISIIAGMGINQLISADNMYLQIKKFSDVLSITEKAYVEDVDTGKLTDAAIVGLLNTLDPHSIYIPPKQNETVMEQFRGKFEGVGISFRILNDTITVIEPIGGGPSARMGVISNDRIVKINDSTCIKWANDQVMRHLRGPKGTKVKISIVRPGVKEILDFVIIRDEISLKSIEASFMLDKEVGYILVNQFKETTLAEMSKALQKLHESGMKRLILDLRNNGGGIMNEAVDMVDLFLDGGTSENPHKIVYTKARRSEFEETYIARTGHQYEKLPLIVLINHASASASEIVAGAIQDWDRGLIVGETSFGKGLVQRPYTLQDGSAIRLTIARYYTPSGRLIQRSYEGKDKDEYQLEALQRDEQEGENLDHKNDAKPDSTIPIFKTNSGRTVLGGGGITPDYVVKSEKATGLILTLFRKNLFYDYVKIYMEGQGFSLREKYKNRYEDFKLKYVITEDFLNEFRKFIENKEIKIDEKEYVSDMNFLKARLKADISQMIFGIEGYWGIIVDVDNQVQKALTLFPEAEKIAKIE
ncbi:MAG: S41 family peptidase [Bacteroidetes bacterium]|nr:S41 family peptidase [Bacteroidota bacterium]